MRPARRSQAAHRCHRRFDGRPVDRRSMRVAACAERIASRIDPFAP
jgi:hypothetical protein